MTLRPGAPLLLVESFAAPAVSRAVLASESKVL
jgi:hypothetical protein